MDYKRLRSKVAALLAFTMILTLSGIVLGASSSNFTDTKGHWAEKQINSWIDKGLIQGYEDGTIKPNAAVSRGEFFALINRAFQFSEQSNVQFKDLSASDWEYADVAKAVKAGYLDGYEDGTIRSKNQISRQEAAVIISKLLKLNTENKNEILNQFRDAQAIASWSQGAVSAVAEKKIMDGYEDLTFKPNVAITRAEAITTIERAYTGNKVFYDKSGTFGPVNGIQTISGDVVIGTSGVNLQNTVITGNLLLAEGIGEGDVFLKNVTVKGTTTVKGGGEHSVHFEDSVLVSILVDKKDGSVRIVAEGKTVVQKVTLQSAATLEESNVSGDGFSDVKLSKELPANSKVTLIGTFQTVDVSVTNVTIEIPKGTIEDFNVDKQSSNITLKLDKEAKIVSLILDAVIKLFGQGTIQTLYIRENAKGSTFEKAPDKIISPSPVPSTPSSGDDNSSTPVRTTAPSASDIHVFNYADGDDEVHVIAVAGSKVRVYTAASGGFLLGSADSVAGSGGAFAKVLITGGFGSLTQIYATVTASGKSESTRVAQSVPGNPPAPVIGDITVTNTVYEDKVRVGNVPGGANVLVYDQAASRTPIGFGQNTGTSAASVEAVIFNQFANLTTAFVAIEINKGESIRTLVAVPPLVAPPLTVQSVAVLSVIQVTYGTALNAVSLPAQVQIMLSDNTTVNVPVTWNGGIPEYDGNTPGTYAFSGTLNMSGLPNVAPTNLKAAVNVVVSAAPRTVQSVTTLSVIQATYGTAWNAVNLPAQVQITLSDNTTVNVPVTWDGGTPAYNGNTVGTYAFAGTLTLSGVPNTAPTNLKASVNVVVAPRTVQSIATLSDIQVTKGTTLNAAGLPTQVQITLSDNTTTTVPVTWDGGTPAYDGNTPGTYAFAGTLDLSAVQSVTNMKAAVNVVVAFAAGQGTALDPYIVKTAFQLNNVRDYLSAYFKLDNDIDLNVTPYNQGEGWLPIGQTKFQGSFDGGGHIIRNMFISRPTKSGGGLFAVVGETGKVDNVKLENVSVMATKNTGGLVAIIYPGGMVSNSSVTGTVYSLSTTEGGQIGGLVGYNYGGTVLNSQASVTVSGIHRLGGLVGNNWGIIKNSRVTASTITGQFLIGGLTGMNYTDKAISDTNGVKATIESSYADSVVVGTRNDTRSGGLVGENAGGTIKNSYAIGSVTGNQYVGGLAGTSEDFTTSTYSFPGVIQNSYAANTVTGASDVGGLVGAQLTGGQVISSFYDSITTGQSDTGKGTPETTANMQQMSTFTGWDFTNIWTITASQYPHLQ